MIDFLKDNIGTIVTGLVVLGVVILIVMNMRKDKKQHKSSCGCNCAGCAMAGSCHSNKKTNNQ